jgi:hypothetical protein
MNRDLDLASGGPRPNPMAKQVTKPALNKEHTQNLMFQQFSDDDDEDEDFKEMSDASSGELPVFGKKSNKSQEIQEEKYEHIPTDMSHPSFLDALNSSRQFRKINYV